MDHRQKRLGKFSAKFVKKIGFRKFLGRAGILGHGEENDALSKFQHTTLGDPQNVQKTKQHKFDFPWAVESAFRNLK